VREYNKRIFQAYLFFFKETADTNPELIRQLAWLSRSFDSNDNSFKIKYNEKAGDQYSDSGNLNIAIEFYKYLLEKVILENADTDRYRILDKLFQLYLDIGHESKLIDIFDKMYAEAMPAGIVLKYIIALLRTSKPSDRENCYLRIIKLLDCLDEKDLNPEEKFRKKFYGIHSLKLNIKDFSDTDNNYKQWKNGLIELVDEIGKLSDRDAEMNNLFGEVMNTLALIYTSSTSISAKDFDYCTILLDNRLQLLAGKNEFCRYDTWEDRYMDLYNCLEKFKNPSSDFSRHDRVSLKFLIGRYRDLYIHSGEPVEKCLLLSEMALEINDKLFDYKGILLSIDPLTNLYIKVGKNKEAGLLIEKGIRIAETFKFSEFELSFRNKKSTVPG
jgi:hypothetical protein